MGITDWLRSLLPEDPRVEELNQLHQMAEAVTAVSVDDAKFWRDEWRKERDAKAEVQRENVRLLERPDPATDLERFETLLNLVGVAYVKDNDPNQYYEGQLPAGVVALRVSAGGGLELPSTHIEKIIGYYGLFTEYIFDEAGKFVTIGIWG